MEIAREIVALADKTEAQFLQAEENIAGEIYKSIKPLLADKKAK